MTQAFPIAHIDPDSAIPLHRQVYSGIREGILAGDLLPGNRLPATRALAEALGVSRATVAEAFDQLATEGYVVGRHGSGTFVAPELPDEHGTPLPAMGGASTDKPNLSAWGHRVALLGSSLQSAVPVLHDYRYDFRPHQIARDTFPWEAWRSSVDEALMADRDGLLRAPPVAGHQGLREAIARHVAAYRGVRCDAGNVVIVNGTQQGLNLLAQLLLEPGDPVVVEDPGYPAARLALTARELDVMRVPVDEDGLCVGLVSDLRSPKLVHVTPSHQDPTGATMSLARRLALLDVARRTGAWIVEDDYDSEFRYEGQPVESLQGLDHAGRVIYAGTFSKSVLPSLRVGFLVLPPQLVSPFIAAKALWDSGTPLLEQAALARFMASGELERHIRRMRRLYRNRRDAIVESLVDAFGKSVSVGKRHGGLNVLVALDLPLNDEEIVSVANEAGIGLRSAREYYASPPECPTFLMGFSGLPEEEIRLGIQQLSKALQRSLSRT